MWLKIATFIVPVAIGLVSAFLTAKDARRLRDEAGDKSLPTKIISGRIFSHDGHPASETTAKTG